ncbi:MULTISPECIES: helix-turn-helix domain-containing protein [Pseudonocardia]|uniref:Transcriptional activator NphR n=2 Tax=Pseudonocardia TaxID=1847 RepID=A0A1Y2N8Y0_PSEAH|nr:MULTISPECIES: helix-turn-helix domain-containing protein [Pseudonocardia]OSY43923.1 Transcriptional activator NphR [Pseudonocardia autotrophica]TDN74344.1 AraC family transcriptional regulator [Pseudonocardia autotrophica]BBG05108.1 hypothetical protein Pdca_63170 [Pseudonocardia autotrophica]GEC27903.1 hypothetical protein PSA01_49320 [Pseudonocardia saturnea]
MAATEHAAPDRHRLGRFDAASVPSAERRRVWSDATARFLVPLEIRSPSRSVDGTIGARRTAGITLCELSATAHLAVRTPALAGGAGAGHVKVALPVRGRTAVTQNGRRVVLCPGQLAVYDTSRPYSVGSDAPFGLLVTLIPRDALELDDGRLERIAARALHGPALAGVRDTLLGAAAAGLTERARDLLLDQLVTLDPDRRVTEPGRDRLRAAATELIHRRIDSTALDPEYLAEALGVSRRTLYLAFAPEGRSVAATIRHARLERARGLLTGPDRHDLQIAEVAAACGFSGAAHFSRLFRAEFGAPPSGFRDRPGGGCTDRQAGSGDRS